MENEVLRPFKNNKTNWIRRLFDLQVCSTYRSVKKSMKQLKNSILMVEAFWKWDVGINLIVIYSLTKLYIPLLIGKEPKKDFLIKSRCNLL